MTDHELNLDNRVEIYEDDGTYLGTVNRYYPNQPAYFSYFGPGIDEGFLDGSLEDLDLLIKRLQLFKQKMEELK